MTESLKDAFRDASKPPGQSEEPRSSRFSCAVNERRRHADMVLFTGTRRVLAALVQQARRPATRAARPAVRRWARLLGLMQRTEYRA